MKKHHFFLLFCFSLCFLIFSSVTGQTTKDSLLNVLKTLKSDTSKVIILNKICEELRYDNLDSALIIGKEALQLSDKIGYKKGIAFCYKSIGTILYYKGELDIAEEYLNKSLEINIEFKNNREIASCYQRLGVIYDNRGLFTKAIEYDSMALKISLEIGDKSKIAICYNNIGICFSSQGNYEKANDFLKKSFDVFISMDSQKDMQYYYLNMGYISLQIGEYSKAVDYSLNSLKMSEKYGDKRGISSNFLLLGSIFLQNSLFDKAIEYYNKSFEISNKRGDKLMTSLYYLDMGDLYLRKKNYYLAKDFFIKSLNLCSEIGNNKEIAANLMNLGCIYGELGELEKAAEYFNKSFKISKEIGDNNEISIYLINIAEISLNLRKFEETINYASEGLKLAVETNNLPVKEALYINLISAYDSIKDYKNAYYTHKLYKLLSDSLSNINKFKQLTEIEAKYQNEKKGKELEIKEFTIKNKNRIIYITIIGLSLTLILLSIISLLYRNNYRAYRSLVQRNIEIINKEKELQLLKKEGNFNKDVLLIDKKYSASLLSEEQKDNFIKRLELYMETEKVYLSPGLTLEQLSEKTEISKKYLSQIINEKYNMNFNNFINKYRVEEARRILANTSNKIPIKKLCPELGFKSFDSFYKSFEKYTGLTPVKFRISIEKLAPK